MSVDSCVVEVSDDLRSPGQRKIWAGSAEESTGDAANRWRDVRMSRDVSR